MSEPILRWCDLEARIPKPSYSIESECIENPLNTIVGGGYKAFNLISSPNGDNKYGWYPHWNTYSQLWCAVKWGVPYYWGHNRIKRRTVKRFVICVGTGEIAWQNYDKTADNYKEENYA